jgi:hypothetical protein
MAKSRDRQTSGSGSRGRKRSPGGREELGTHRWKVLRIAGAACLSRGRWPTRSWRFEEGRLAARREPVRGEARQGRQRRGERPVTRERTSRAAGPFARRSESRRRETLRSPQPHDGSENARGAGARSECVGKQTSVGRIQRRTRGEPQGRPGERASPRKTVIPLVRVAAERRRTGALESRRVNPMTRGGPCGRWACESCTQHRRVWTRRKAPRVLRGLLTGDPFSGNARRPWLAR